MHANVSGHAIKRATGSCREGTDMDMIRESSIFSSDNIKVDSTEMKVNRRHMPGSRDPRPAQCLIMEFSDWHVVSI